MQKEKTKKEKKRKPNSIIAVKFQREAEVKTACQVATHPLNQAMH